MIFHQLKVADGEEKMNSKYYIFNLNFFVSEKNSSTMKFILQCHAPFNMNFFLGKFRENDLQFNEISFFFFSALLECMVLPLQDKLEDWKKSAIQLDKDHAKEYKKLRSDIKKKSEAVQRAHKKQKKSKSGNEQAQVYI